MLPPRLTHRSERAHCGAESCQSLSLLSCPARHFFWLVQEPTPLPPGEVPLPDPVPGHTPEPGPGEIICGPRETTFAAAAAAPTVEQPARFDPVTATVSVTINKKPSTPSTGGFGAFLYAAPASAHAKTSARSAPTRLPAVAAQSRPSVDRAADVPRFAKEQVSAHLEVPTDVQLPSADLYEPDFAQADLHPSTAAVEQPGSRQQVDFPVADLALMRFTAQEAQLVLPAPTMRRAPLLHGDKCAPASLMASNCLATPLQVAKSMLLHIHRN